MDDKFDREVAEREKELNLERERLERAKRDHEEQTRDDMKQIQLKQLELDNRVADINERESFLVKMVQKIEAKKATVEEEEDALRSHLDMFEEEKLMH